MPCLCQSCAEEPGPTYTQEFRHKTEVEFVAKQSDEWIKSFLDGVRVKRGDAAWMRLRADVIKEWKQHK